MKFYVSFYNPEKRKVATVTVIAKTPTGARSALRRLGNKCTITAVKPAFASPQEKKQYEKRRMAK